MNLIITERMISRMIEPFKTAAYLASVVIKPWRDFAQEKTNRLSMEKHPIPFGKHSYGPSPKLLGHEPWLTKRMQGSKIGKYCSIAPGLTFSFYGVQDHDYHNVSTYPFAAYYEKWHFNNRWCTKGKPNVQEVQPEPIVIENDVWIGENVTIKEGITVANGAVIGMNSFVTKNVPPYAIVGGNPAKIVKYRFTDVQIAELLRIAWWNWSDSEVREALPIFNNIDLFIKVAKGSIGETTQPIQNRALVI
jgi:acetyltransferase-like isoleucine patch superfamily enzyme